MAKAVFEHNTGGPQLDAWRKTYANARDLAGEDDEELAREAYAENNAIEAEMIAAPPSLEAAQACIFAAISLMTDECEGEEEPSYADLLRAVARHLGLTEMPAPTAATCR